VDAPEEVPESRLRDDLVRRKDAHTIDFGSWLGLRGQMTPDDLVFLKAHLQTYRWAGQYHPTSISTIHPFPRLCRLTLLTQEPHSIQPTAQVTLTLNDRRFLEEKRRCVG
jgi:hypothetical protein